MLIHFQTFENFKVGSELYVIKGDTATVLKDKVKEWGVTQVSYTHKVIKVLSQKCCISIKVYLLLMNLAF